MGAMVVALGRAGGRLLLVAAGGTLAFVEGLEAAMGAMFVAFGRAGGRLLRVSTEISIERTTNARISARAIEAAE